MTGERTRGVLLYAGAALVLVAGGFWWFRAAPHEQVDSRIQAWRASAERMLPDLPTQADANTFAFAAGEDHEVDANVENGGYEVWVICVGGDGSEMRVSLGDADDSGRGLDCAGDHAPDTFNVAVAGQLRMNVSVGNAGPVVFRYALVRSAD